MAKQTDIAKAKIEYMRWLSCSVLDRLYRSELIDIGKDDGAILDQFWQQLAFGTGGLRGIIGAGTNRMNELVVRRATQGLADYIKTCGGKSVCIAYDTRHFSLEFAIAAAETLCANGIIVYLFTDVRPTPMLSFSVREKKAFAGIVITASHNPSNYNGYKVYGADGGQITDSAAKAISEYIDGYDILADRSRMPLITARENGLLFDLDNIDPVYYSKVKALVVRNAVIAEHAKQLSVLYTPLHGAGNVPVRSVLGDLGFNVSVVEEQELPDGNFPTVHSPNPEEAEVFELAQKKTEGQAFDIILATDPDCDRIGVQVRNHNGIYGSLTGNQIGALLCDYLITAKKEGGTLCDNSAVVKTIVTTELARKICEMNGIELFETLTGFKYIGEKISEWERSGEYSFLLGFEESYGYLAGDFVRDKDAVIASVLICEMTLYYKLRKMNLLDALDKLFSRYGYADERLISVTLDGKAGHDDISAIMKRLCLNPTKFFVAQIVTVIEDYMDGFNGLPKSNVIKLRFSDGSWLAVRPSGTEPKLKFYFGATGDTRLQVNKRLGELEHAVKSVIMQRI